MLSGGCPQSWRKIPDIGLRSRLPASLRRPTVTRAGGGNRTRALSLERLPRRVGRTTANESGRSASHRAVVNGHEPTRMCHEICQVTHSALGILSSCDELNFVHRTTLRLNRQLHTGRDEEWQGAKPGAVSRTGDTWHGGRTGDNASHPAQRAGEHPGGKGEEPARRGRPGPASEGPEARGGVKNVKRQPRSPVPDEVCAGCGTALARSVYT